MSKKLKILFIGEKKVDMLEQGALREAMQKLGELTTIFDAQTLPEKKRAEMIRDTDILLTMWNAAPIPLEIAENPGRLSYICNITGSVRKYIPLEVIKAGIPVSNWGDAPAHGVAESAVSLLLAVLKDIRVKIMNVRNDKWGLEKHQMISGSVKNLNVGIYGFGVIGRRFAEILNVFGALEYVFDPYVENLPEYCTRVSSLKELFEISEAIAIHAGLCDETRGTVNADMLSLLPDNGIVINTARGDIIDQQALFKELESGRLRAGLDVLSGNDRLPPGHPARKWDNLILTCHNNSKVWWPKRPGELNDFQNICIENIKRHIAGEPLKFRMDEKRYMRST
jgi:phosphoglycerate dehydrogenase-like enzyme